MSTFFQTQSCGKWILTGEHAVIRGHKAIAFPYREKTLSLQVSTLETPFSFFPHKDESSVFDFLSAAKKILGDTFPDIFSHPRYASFPYGTFICESSLPQSSGFGSSAAFCVSFARFFIHLFSLPSSSLFSLSQNLENYFHKKSSGLDVKVVDANEPLVFQKGLSSILPIKKWPLFEFYPTHLVADTKTCVEKVQHLFSSDPVVAKKTDEKMHEASEKAEQGLLFYQESQTQKKGYELIKESMQQAQECFFTWDLVPPPIAQQIQSLYQHGASAVKLTGKGAGGFLVVLRA